MEPIIHAQPKRRKNNSAKVNLIISIAFHGLLIGGAAYWAAYEGVLGKKMQELTMTLVPKEKKAEPEKKPEPRFEAPKKVETARAADQPVVAAPTVAAPAAPAVETVAAASDAPPPAEMPSFSFGEGVTQTDPVTAHKAYIERTLRARWVRPEGLNDSAFVAQVDLSVDASGNVQNWSWKSGSGDKRWDDSVRAVVDATKSFNRVSPQGFPPSFTVRFDVVPDQELPLSDGAELESSLMQASLR
jgi:hypothetical protein